MPCSLFFEISELVMVIVEFDPASAFNPLPRLFVMLLSLMLAAVPERRIPSSGWPDTVVERRVIFAFTPTIPFVPLFSITLSFASSELASRITPSAPFSSIVLPTSLASEFFSARIPRSSFCVTREFSSSALESVR